MDDWLVFRLIDRLAGWWFDWRMHRKIATSPELDDMELKRLEMKDGNFELLIATQTVGILADQMAVLLQENNAENFVQCDMMPRLDRGLRPVRVTVQWANGLSPAKKCAMLEAKVERLQAEIEELKPMAEYGENLACSFP